MKLVIAMIASVLMVGSMSLAADKTGSSADSQVKETHNPVTGSDTTTTTTEKKEETADTKMMKKTKHMHKVSKEGKVTDETTTKSETKDK
jgi:hypothetical protein